MMSKIWHYPTFKEYLESVDNIELFNITNLDRLFNIAYDWSEDDFVLLLRRAIQHHICSFETLLNLYQYFDKQKITKSQYIKIIINNYKLSNVIKVEKTERELIVKYDNLIISEIDLRLTHYQNLLTEILEEILFFCDLVEEDILTSTNLKYIVNEYVTIFKNIETLTSILR